MEKASTVSEPPQTLWQSLAHLGPGIVLASSIVGSGELIATTIVGAEAGFVLLWLIILGCAIKVAAQIEIGRTTLTWGRTLGAMYAPVFGDWARGVFLIGAFAVLYSTLFVAAAGNARMVVDGLILSGRLPADEASRAIWSKRLSVVWPLAALILALIIREPVGMVLASGIAQAIMLAALGVAVLFFRHRDFDARLTPSRGWDLLLWLSSAGFILIGIWTLLQKVASLL